MHLLHLDQPLLEINITPDRGYTLSYRGVAREYHHSTGAAYTDPAVALNEKAPEPADYQPGTPVDIDVEIDDNNPIHGVPGCDRYYARIVKDFNPNAHTPNWMRRRLIRAGMRSISLAVDVTNYVMLDLGQPMHAYDLDKLEGPIVVRRANEGEKLTTLDGKEHDLSVEDSAYHRFAERRTRLAHPRPCRCDGRPVWRSDRRHQRTFFWRPRTSIR